MVTVIDDVDVLLHPSVTVTVYVVVEEAVAIGFDIVELLNPFVGSHA